MEENKIYISSDGSEKNVEEMNSFNLLNALVKNTKIEASVIPFETQKAEILIIRNIVNLKAEILRRLDTRPRE